ncbi:RNA exonuclease 4, partial [Caerostris darwini]
KESLIPSATKVNDQEEEEEKPIRLTAAVAIDCEMVGTGPTGKDSILARVSIVNEFGECIYDEFVKPKEKVTDYRTEVSGVRPADLKEGKDLYEVQQDVLCIIHGRKVVGHDLKHDFDALLIGHPKYDLRDTSKYKPFREIANGRTPSLKKLTAKVLNCDIQSGEHSSIEDAQAAMLLYLVKKKEWERSIKRKKRRS